MQSGMATGSLTPWMNKRLCNVWKPLCCIVVMPGEHIEMTTSRRVTLSLLVAAIVLFLAMLFWPFVVNNILRPSALAIWLLLRILVLSIHQQYFWYAVIFAALLFLFRLLPKKQSDIQSDIYLETNSTIINIGYWRGLFTYTGQNIRDEKAIKQELIHLLASLYATKNSITTNWLIYDALQQGKIPLPGKIHTFLFPQDPPLPGGPLIRFFHSIRKTLRNWIRQWTGLEKAEHYQMIDEVLRFLETSLEIKNDDGKR
jgi:type IV secretory pathway VirB3-like protein